MTEGRKEQTLEAQLWGIANLLRGKIGADDYRDYFSVSFFINIGSLNRNRFEMK